MVDSTFDQQMGALRRQITFLWILTSTLAIALAIVVAAGAMLYSKGVNVPVTSTLASLTLGDSKSGHRLVLNGDGFQLLNKDGNTVALLNDSDDGGALKLNRWVRPSNQIDVAIAEATGKELQLKVGPPENTNSADVTASTVYLSKGPTTAGIQPGDMFFHDGNTSGNFGLGSISVWNQCDYESPTCFESHASLNSNFLGLQIESCERHNGMPINSKQKNEGCMTVGATGRGFDGEGAQVSLGEDGVNRLVLGSTTLTRPRVGGREITPLSQISGFDSKNILVWKIPQY